MKASELRIGNYVSIISKEPEYLKIEGTKIYDDQSDEDCVRLESFDYWTDVEDIEPIPLTEDWLLKFGFEYDQLCWNLDSKISWGNGVFKFSQEQRGSTIFLHCQYVHQLQNLFFYLTWEELPISPLPKSSETEK